MLLASEGVNRVDDVPLIDSLGVTIKMTETFVDLRASTGLAPSRHGLRHAAPRPERGHAGDGFLSRAKPDPGEMKRTRR